LELKTREESEQFIAKLVKGHLRNEISAKETAIVSEFQSSMSSEMAQLFYNAPDVYYAAAILHSSGIYIGKGDTSSILRMFIKSNEPLKAAKDKLILLQMGMFHNVKMFADKFKAYPSKFNLCPRRIHKLWLKMVRVREDLSGP